MVECAMVIAPESKMAPLDTEALNYAIDHSPLYGRYEEMIDRESAYEKLSAGHFVTLGQVKEVEDNAQQDSQNNKKEGLMGGLNSLIFGSVGPRGAKHDGIVQSAVKSVVKNAVKRMVRNSGKRILRGVIGVNSRRPQVVGRLEDRGAFYHRPRARMMPINSGPI